MRAFGPSYGSSIAELISCEPCPWVTVAVGLVKLSIVAQACSKLPKNNRVKLFIKKAFFVTLSFLYLKNFHHCGGCGRQTVYYKLSDKYN
ncbi:hypothetical protein THIOM_001612 [Candidatus Thiomargarita nelsonii]|uniref:Uncharacterized protein n=1 Tax=Candidatus Thiomargarita nelsonii TaxID=1003181 RepID=A0A176S3T7_9GAMM|nr:hypothetical protein THIOM_001612 [Candidatus Thiomargarita nelsonii]